MYIIKLILTNYTCNQNNHSLWGGGAFLSGHSLIHQSFIKDFWELKVVLGTKHKKDKKIRSSFEKLNIYWENHLILVHCLYVNLFTCNILSDFCNEVMFYHHHFRDKEMSQQDKGSNLLASNSLPIQIPCSCRIPH